MVSLEKYRTHPVSAALLLLGRDEAQIKVSFTEIRLDNAVICGDGFNERTVKIAVGGREYFVFRKDLEAV